MGERAQTVQEVLTFLQDTGSWRQELFEKVLQVISIAALPLILLSLYYVYVTQNAGIMVIVLLAYGVVLMGAWVPSLPYVGRVWAFLSVLLILGVLDLIVFGWGEDARIYLLAAMLFAVIFLGGRHGLAVLITVCAILTLFVLAVTVGIFVPVNAVVSPYASMTLLSGWVTFVVFAVGLFTVFNHVFPRLFAALQKSSALSVQLEEEQAVLAQRTQVLQAANLSLQRRAMYLEATTQVSQALVSIFELEVLLQRAVDMIAVRFNFYHVGIFIMDDTGDWAVMRAASSAGGRRMVAQGYRLRSDEHNLMGRVVLRQVPELAKSGESLLAEAMPEDLPATLSELALPLVAAGRLIGVLDIQSSEEYAFDDDDVRALGGLASLLAVFIANTQRLSKDKALASLSSSVYRLTHELARTRTEQEVYTAMLLSLQDFNPTQAFIFRTDSVSSGVYTVAEMRGSDLNVYEQYRTDEDVHDLIKLVKVCAQLSAPLLIGDLSSSYTSGEPDVDAALAHLSEILDVLGIGIVPLHFEEEFLGVLLVIYDAPHQFSALQMQLYRTLSDLAGIALERTALVQRIEARLERERWVQDFGEQVMRIPDLETIMTQSVQALQEIAQADGVMVALTVPEDSSGSGGGMPPQ